MPSLNLIFAWIVTVLAAAACIGALVVVLVAEVYAIRRTIERHRRPGSTLTDPSGKPVKLTLTDPSGWSDYQTSLEIVKSNLAEIGIHLPQPGGGDDLVGVDVLAEDPDAGH